MQYALSGQDLVDIVGDISIVKYPDLDETSIPALFKKRKQAVVLFLTESKTMGHWQALLLHPGNIIEVFDSFGMPVDGGRKWLSEKKKNELDQHEPQLEQLIEKTNLKCVYNAKKLQSEAVNTCGRHVACRIMHGDKSLKEYLALIENSGLPPDEFVTLVTYKKLGK